MTVCQRLPYQEEKQSPAGEWRGWGVGWLGTGASVFLETGRSRKDARALHGCSGISSGRSCDAWGGSVEKLLVGVKVSTGAHRPAQEGELTHLGQGEAAAQGEQPGQGLHLALAAPWATNLAWEERSSSITAL